MMDRLRRIGAGLAALFLAFAFTTLPVVGAPNPIAKTLVQGGQAAGSTNSQYPVLVAGIDASGVIRTQLVDSGGSVFRGSATASGSLDAVDEAATISSLFGASSVAIDLRGVFVATVTFEATVDGTNWTVVRANPVIGGVPASTATATGSWVLPAGGYLGARARVSAYTSGTITAVLRGEAGTHSVFSTPVGSAITLSDGQPNTPTVLLTSGGAAVESRVFPVIYNGATHDRLRSATAADGANTGVLACGMMARGSGALQTMLQVNPSDGDSGGRGLQVFGGQYNNSTWDKPRNNVESNLLTIAALTTSQTSADTTNYNARGLVLYTSVTVNPGGAQTLTINLQAKDETGNDEYYTVATSGAIAVFGAAAGATGLEVITVYPGAAETAALTGFTTQALPVPRTWRVQVVHSGAGAWTYKSSYSYIQ